MIWLRLWFARDCTASGLNRTSLRGIVSHIRNWQSIRLSETFFFLLSPRYKDAKRTRATRYTRCRKLRAGEGNQRFLGVHGQLQQRRNAARPFDTGSVGKFGGLVGGERPYEAIQVAPYLPSFVPCEARARQTAALATRFAKYGLGTCLCRQQIDRNPAMQTPFAYLVPCSARIWQQDPRSLDDS